MLKVILIGLKSALKFHRRLILENNALRHQLEVLQRNSVRPRLRPSDRALWALLSRTLPGWRLYWRWRSRPGRGRPKVSAEARALIRRISLENPLWGAPHIHGELLKLGYDICETTIAKYMVRRPGSPTQTWRTFTRNHMAEIAAIDFFTVPTVTFKTLYVFLMSSWSSLSTVDGLSTSTSQPIRPQLGRACS